MAFIHDSFTIVMRWLAHRHHMVQGAVYHVIAGVQSHITHSIKKLCNLFHSWRLFTMWQVIAHRSSCCCAVQGTWTRQSCPPAVNVLLAGWHQCQCRFVHTCFLACTLIVNTCLALSLCLKLWACKILPVLIGTGLFLHSHLHHFISMGGCTQL